jgi:hypothetical protein
MKLLAVAAVAALTIAVLSAAPADAQGIRSFVSAAEGSDSNNCGRGSPCRTLAVALQATNPFGEIVVLDPGGYGPVTINKSVSIVNDGVGFANITNGTAGANTITVAAGVTDVINLRGLTINGAGIDLEGILFTGGGTLNVQDCVIRGFTANGINFVPIASSSLTVVDTIVSNIGGTTAAIVLQPTGTGLTVTAYVDGVQVSGNNQHAIDVNTQTMSGGSLQATVANSTLTDNPNGAGVLIPVLSGPIVTLINTRLTNNSVGVNAGGGAVYLAETTISGNTANGFIVRPGASILTFGNNRITDTTNTGTLTTIPKQ